MDGLSGYNQIKIYPEDEKHTSFRTPVGVYCYTVMPLRLEEHWCDISMRHEWDFS